MNLKWKIYSLVWFCGISLFIAALHVEHNVEFSPPSASQVSSQFSSLKDKNYGAMHFIAADCSCSKHIINYLIKRGHYSEFKEQVVIIGELQGKQEELEKKGFAVTSLTIEQAQDVEAFQAVPLLVVYDKEMQVLYTGGYTESSITPLSEFKDLQAFKSVEQGKSLKGLPLKGCAVSRSYQKMLDPFGLKYKREKT